MVGTLIVLGFLYVIFLIWNVSTDNKDVRLFSALLLTIVAIIFAVLLSLDENGNTPTALEVYQEKTTLEITYKDSVPIDSVVVWKEEIK